MGGLTSSFQLYLTVPDISLHFVSSFNFNRAKTIAITPQFKQLTGIWSQPPGRLDQDANHKFFFHKLSSHMQKWLHQQALRLPSGLRILTSFPTTKLEKNCLSISTITRVVNIELFGYFCIWTRVTQHQSFRLRVFWILQWWGEAGNHGEEIASALLLKNDFGKFLVHGKNFRWESLNVFTVKNCTLRHVSIFWFRAMQRPISQKEGWLPNCHDFATEWNSWNHVVY